MAPSPPAGAIEASLLEWRGVESVRVEPRHDRVTVVLNSDTGPRGNDLLWSLRMLGFEWAREHRREVNPF